MRRVNPSSLLRQRSSTSALHQTRIKKSKYSTVSTTKRTTLFDLRKKFVDKKPLVMVTSYSASETALIDLLTFNVGAPEKADAIDAILVGDSAGMVVAGQRDTTPVTMDDMVYHCKAATATARKVFVIGDMPFGSYEVSDEDAVRNAIRLVKEGRVDAVKLEGGRRMAKRVESITNAGIAVMGHIGLTPQSQSALGGFRVQGRTAEEAALLIEDAKALDKAGCFAIVVECVPEVVAKAITAAISIPTIGIGAGNTTGGQILVFHDMFGLFSEFQPKFTKRFRDAGAEIVAGLKEYSTEVTSRSFPAAEHTFSMKQEEQDKLAVRFNNQASTRTAPFNIKSSIRKKKIAVIGGGSMGSLFAARLAEREQNDVCLVSGWKDHVERINSNGMLLLPPSSSTEQTPRLVQTLRATSSPSDAARIFEGNADLALIMVKSSHTKEAAEKAAQILDLTPGRVPTGYALTLQNGLGNLEILANRLGSHRVLQGITSHGAMVLAPGIVQHTGVGFLTLANPISVSVDESAALSSNSGIEYLQAMRSATDSTAAALTDAGFAAQVASENMESLVWGKLIVNAVINPLTALLGVKNGELLNRPDALQIINKAVNEVVAVAHARGVELPWPNPTDTVLQVIRNTAENKSSMLQDVMRGQETEIDAITGAIVREAERLGVDAHVNKAILQLLVQEKLSPGKTNLDRILTLVSKQTSS